MSSFLDTVRTRARGMLGLGAITGLVGYIAGVVWGAVDLARWSILLRDPEL